MKARSWDQLGLDGTKVILFTTTTGASLFLVVAVAANQLQIGGGSVVLGVIAAAGACYLVTTTPKRIIERAAYEQTLEAPAFAASSNIYLKSTSSRSKTLLLVRSGDPRLARFLATVRRQTLLGYDAEAAIEGGRPQSHVFSESVKTVLNAIVGVGRARVEEGGEELDGILNSSDLDDETKLPLFIAVSFFLPIMLMLFAATTRGTGTLAMASLVVLEVVLLDIALTFSGSSVGWWKAGGKGEKS